MNLSKLSINLLCAALVLECSWLIVAQITLQPAKIEIKESKYKNGVCFSEHNHKRLQSEVEEVIHSRIVPQLLTTNPCANIDQELPAGFYRMNISDEPLQVYCYVSQDRCCNESDGKWMRIAYLNMSDPSAQCPQDWREVDSPIRTCRRQFQTSINSVNYSSYGIPYSKVCGRIVAYQFGTPEGFFGFFHQKQTTIDDAYVDGISITYGHPKNHIWTFAVSKKNCPCIATPPFIKDDLFCESGTNFFINISFIDNNPLWDGHGCTGSSTCCEFNNPPWFCKQLPEPTTEDIEIRIIGNVYGIGVLEEEDTPVQLIEVYVQ